MHILVPSYEDPLCSYYPTQGAVRSDGISFQHGSSACLQHGVMDGGQDRIKIGFGDQQGYLHLGGGYQPQVGLGPGNGGEDLGGAVTDTGVSVLTK